MFNHEQCLYQLISLDKNNEKHANDRSYDISATDL